MRRTERQKQRVLIRPRVLKLLRQLDAFVSARGVESFLVGGLVRDALLGRDTADIDIAVRADALEVAREVALFTGGGYAAIDAKDRIGRVVLAGTGSPMPDGKQCSIDFSTVADSIEEDLLRRDFTIDAMAFRLSEMSSDPQRARLIDPSGGCQDIESGVVRVVSEQAFLADPVRLLRAVRLAAELGFKLDGETEAGVVRHARLITTTAGERLREELLRLLALPGGHELFAYLDRLGLLAALIPELALTRDVTQPKEHFWNVLDHSLHAVTAVDFLLRRGAWLGMGNEVLSPVPWSDELADYFAAEVRCGSTRRQLLKLAALLHDIAKPQTMTRDIRGRWRFFGHGSQGAEATVGILERLRFSVRETRLVATMVEHHLRPVQLSQGDELPSHRAIYRYFRDAGESGVDILFLSLADHLATRGPGLDLASWRVHAREAAYILEQRNQQAERTTVERLINGHDLIGVFGLEPGRTIGEILKQVQEAQATGELTDRESALSYVRRLLEERLIPHV